MATLVGGDRGGLAGERRVQQGRPRREEAIEVGYCLWDMACRTRLRRLQHLKRDTEAASREMFSRRDSAHRKTWLKCATLYEGISPRGAGCALYGLKVGKMAELLLDPAIRMWVILPIVLITLVFGLLRHYVTILLSNASKVPTLEEVKDG